MPTPSSPGTEPDRPQDVGAAPEDADGSTDGPVLTTDDEAQRDDLLVDPGAS